MGADDKRKWVGPMPGLRERFADLVDGGSRTRKIEGMVEAIGKEIARKPWMFSDQVLLDRLGELDSHMLDFMLRQQGYRLLQGAGGIGGNFFQSINEQQRLDIVDLSRWTYWQDVTIRRIVQMWTDFGFGQYIQVVPNDESLMEVWDEFWGAKRNGPIFQQRKIHQLSNDLLVDGEYFFQFTASTTDGLTTIRRIPTDAISKIIHDEGDKDIPLFYVRPLPTTEKSYNEIWYPDWQNVEEGRNLTLPSNAIRADEVQASENGMPGTMVVAMQVALNEINGRGWPQFWPTFTWSDAYRNFLENRATIAKRVAMWIDKVTVQGGSRAVDALTANFQTALRSGDRIVDNNPPASAGSDWIQNQSVNRERMPLGTAAGDAQVDGLMLLGQVSAGSGTPLDWMGRPDAMQNRAVADHTSLPWLEQMERYQELWADVFTDMVEIVADMKTKATGEQFPDREAEVILPSPLHLEPDTISSSMDAITTAAGQGILDGDVANRALESLTGLLLGTLGVRDVESVLEPEIPEEEPEEGPLAAFYSRDGQMQALLSLGLGGSPLSGWEPAEVKEAIDRQLRVIRETCFSEHGDLRAKAEKAVKALEALRERYS